MARTSKVNVTETPEFKTALEAGIAAATERILATLAAAKGAAAPGVTDASEPVALTTSDRGFAEGLALAIANIGNQGVGRTKIVAPEVLAARDGARERMIDLIIQARADGVAPAYRLTQKCYLDEQMVEPMWIGPDHVARPTEIEWPGVPNHAMVPVNEIATEIHAAFMASVGSTVSTPRDDTRSLAITAGGVVVRGGSRSMNRNEANQVGNQRGADPHGEGLKLRGRTMPGAVREINVLGTVASPARQQA